MILYDPFKYNKLTHLHDVILIPSSSEFAYRDTPFNRNRVFSSLPKGGVLESLTIEMAFEKTFLRNVGWLGLISIHLDQSETSESYWNKSLY